MEFAKAGDMDGKPEGVSERERANQSLRRNHIGIRGGIHRKPLLTRRSFSGGGYDASAEQL